MGCFHFAALAYAWGTCFRGMFETVSPLLSESHICLVFASETRISLTAEAWFLSVSPRRRATSNKVASQSCTASRRAARAANLVCLGASRRGASICEALFGNVSDAVARRSFSASFRQRLLPWSVPCAWCLARSGVPKSMGDLGWVGEESSLLKRYLPDSSCWTLNTSL